MLSKRIAEWFVRTCCVFPFPSHPIPYEAMRCVRRGRSTTGSSSSFSTTELAFGLGPVESRASRIQRWRSPAWIGLPLLLPPFPSGSHWATPDPQNTPTGLALVTFTFTCPALAPSRRNCLCPDRPDENKILKKIAHKHAQIHGNRIARCACNRRFSNWPWGNKTAVLALSFYQWTEQAHIAKHRW